MDKIYLVQLSDKKMRYESVHRHVVANSETEAEAVTRMRGHNPFPVPWEDVEIRVLTESRMSWRGGR